MIVVYKIEFWDRSTYLMRADLDNFEKEVQQLLDHKKQMFDSLTKEIQEWVLTYTRKTLGTLVKITKLEMSEDEYLDIFLELKRIIEMRNNYEKVRKEKAGIEQKTIQRDEKFVNREFHNIKNGCSQTNVDSG